MVADISKSKLINNIDMKRLSLPANSMRAFFQLKIKFYSGTDNFLSPKTYSFLCFYIHQVTLIISNQKADIFNIKGQHCMNYRFLHLCLETYPRTFLR